MLWGVLSKNSIAWRRTWTRATTRHKVAQGVCKAPDIGRGLGAQTNGANCECRGRVWRMDVGMSKGVLDALPQVGACPVPWHHEQCQPGREEQLPLVYSAGMEGSTWVRMCCAEGVLCLWCRCWRFCQPARTAGLSCGSWRPPEPQGRCCQLLWRGQSCGRTTPFEAPNKGEPEATQQTLYWF